jgi:hypothetical protein
VRLAEAERGALHPEVLHAADAVCRWFARKRVPRERMEDLRQQAVLVGLESLRSFDAARGDAGGYLYASIRRSVGKELARWASPVSLSEPAIKRGERPAAARPPRRRDDDGALADPVEAIPDDAPGPEAALARRQRAAGYPSARVAHRRALEARLRGMGASERRALEDVLGLTGAPPMGPGEAARVHGLEEGSFGRLVRRFRDDAVASVELSILRREMHRLDPEEDDCA